MLARHRLISHRYLNLHSHCPILKQHSMSGFTGRSCFTMVAVMLHQRNSMSNTRNSAQTAFEIQQPLCHIKLSSAL